VTATPTEARDVAKGDRIRLEPHGTLWTVTRKRRVGNSVWLWFGNEASGATTWLVCDGRLKLYVIT
jgi:hypothetical protein